MSKEHDDLVRSVLDHNARLIDERGPRLHYDLRHVVLARDETGGHVLIGGLGALGVGKLWCRLRRHAVEEPGYNLCPVVPAPTDDDVTAVAQGNVLAEDEALERLRARGTAT